MKRSRTTNRLVVVVVALSALFELAAWPSQRTTASEPPNRTETPVGSSGNAVPAEKETILNTLKQTPLLFVENRGQMDARVAYYIHGRDTSLYFTPQGITLSLTGGTTV